MFNPKYEELFAPEVGPENPFKTQQQKANKNMLSGYVEKAHLNEFEFENQRRTFHSYGYAVDPSSTSGVEESLIISENVDSEAPKKTVFEKVKPRPLDKRKKNKNDNPEDIEGFLGPWATYVDEKRVVKPTEEEAEELEEILAKRQKRGKFVEEKPMEEKTILHSVYLLISVTSILII